MSQEELSSAQKAALMVTSLIMSAVNDAEPYGVMGSELYGAVTGIGCPLECFTAIIEALVAHGILERHGSCYCRSTKLSRSMEISLAE